MHGNGNRRGALIHPTAIISPEAQVADTCEIGPFCIIAGNVSLGPNCRLKTGVIIGTEPMDKKYQGENTAVDVGADNIFFEYVTVHRATGEGESTIIGDRNYIMSYVHIAHNCRLGSDCVLTCGVLLGGHCEVGDGANIGGATGVHQHCRLGTLSMIGAHSYVNLDIPPFVLASGNPCRVFGLNLVGLKRAGFSEEKIGILKEAWRLLYRARLPLNLALRRIESELLPGPAETEIRQLLDFCGSSRRGVELRTVQGGRL
uniref:Acyl-ACP--UDP-N-acetylglucosamine O-acyltransferase n=1 Tax=candidate division WOR-3 bacterium TaxID=2052148 RepID=A0A7V3UZY0_UNCW3